MTGIGRGVTGFDTIGMYSDKGRRTLMCIAGKREVIEIKKIVNEYDKKAFLIVSGVTEVQGEGFLWKMDSICNENCENCHIKW